MFSLFLLRRDSELRLETRRDAFADCFALFSFAFDQAAREERGPEEDGSEGEGEDEEEDEEESEAEMEMEDDE